MKKDADAEGAEKNDAPEENVGDASEEDPVAEEESEDP